MNHRRYLAIAFSVVLGGAGCQRCGAHDKGGAPSTASSAASRVSVDAGLAGSAETVATVSEVTALDVTDQDVVWLETPSRRRGDKRDDAVHAVPKKGGDRRTIARTATRPWELAIAGGTVAWVETFDSSRGYDLFFAPLAGGAPHHVDGRFGGSLAASGTALFIDDERAPGAPTIREVVPPSESGPPVVTEHGVLRGLCASPARICWGKRDGDRVSIRCQGRAEKVGDELIEEPKIDLAGCGEHYVAFVQLEANNKTALVAYELATKKKLPLAQWARSFWTSSLWTAAFREMDDALYYATEDSVYRRSLADGQTTRLFPYEGPFAVDRTHIYFVFDHAIRRLPR